jgi:tetratricopeptide (TPR) repeat protein
VIELLGQSEVEAEKTLAIGAVHALPGAKERARILRDMGECLVAANAYKEAGDWVGAGDCYREAQAWEEARAAYARAGAWEQWSELTGELEKWEDLVERYLQTGEYVQAAEIYAEKLGLFLEAADCYDRANLHPEAFAAYCRVSPEKMTEAAQRRLADLAEEMGEVDVALETYQALGELTKAAQLAETSERYEQALAFYQEIGPPLKVAEMLEKLARYAEAAEVFMQNELWGRAALSLEKQVEQELERLGGVRHARRNEQLQAWLQRAVELFEDEGEVADSEKDRDFFYRGARRCRNKLAQLKREPLLKVSVETERLIVDQSSVVRCVVENVGWGTARNLTLNVSSPHLKYPIDPIRLGDLRRGEQVSNVCSVVPNIAGDLVLQVKFRGRTRSGEERDFPMAGGNNVTLNTQARLEARPEPEAELGSLWEESDTGSTEEPDSGVVFQTELELQEVESLKRRLARHHANLNKLQEQASLFGAGRTPLDLLNQIEAEEQAIVEVEERLQELKG